MYDSWIEKFLLEAEKAAKETKKPTNKDMVDSLYEIRADKKLSTAAHGDDGAKIQDGSMVRAPEEMIKYASQYP